MSLQSFFNDKKIAVTGGCGSVGSYLVDFLMNTDCAAIKIIDINEDGIFEILRRNNDEERLDAYVCDIRNTGRLTDLFWGIDYVFHLAAAKHVALCERSPLEAVSTNIEGTRSVIEACINASIRRCIFTSTDKAVNPTNAMGATKLVAEKLITAANFENRSGTIFSCTRFGNVLGSNGSVVKIFVDQILRGSPITVTDPEMTRFIMSGQESVRLICAAMRLSEGGEIFVPKMPAVSIGDLVHGVIRVLRSHGKLQDFLIPEMQEIGSRLGERKHEELMTEDEGNRASVLDDLYLINSQYNQAKLRKDGLTVGAGVKGAGYNSGSVTRMDDTSLDLFLSESGVISALLEKSYGII